MIGKRRALGRHRSGTDFSSRAVVLGCDSTDGGAKGVTSSAGLDGGWRMADGAGDLRETAVDLTHRAWLVDWGLPLYI